MRSRPRLRKTAKRGGLVIAGAAVVASVSGWVCPWSARIGRAWPGPVVWSLRIDSAPWLTVERTRYDGWEIQTVGWLFHHPPAERVWPWVYRGPPGCWSAWVPLWIPAAVGAAVAGAAHALDRRAARRARVGRCPACGYDRAGLTAGVPCPECGAPA